MFEDKTLVCSNCNDEFEFTAGEQEFYAQKEYTAPKRCKKCIAERKQQQQQRRYN